MTAPASTPTRRRLASESGQSVVEFALVLPIVVMILFAILDFALALNYANDLNHVAAEGARRAAVNQDTAFDPVAYVKDAAEVPVREGMTVAVCLPAGAQPGGPVKIKASRPYALLRVLPGLTTINLSGRAAMRLEAPATFTGAASSASCD